MLNPKYLIYHDLIGIEVYGKLNSRNKKGEFSDLGYVIDETRNMLITEKESKVQKYIKKDHVFRFKVPNYKENGEDFILEIQGSEIVGSPVNRLRSLKKKRWSKK